MGRKKKKFLPLLERLHIIDIAAEGKAIARYEDMVVFIKNAVPGDVADIQITRKRRRYFEGIPSKFHTYSSNRAEPFCEHFGVCGGCRWQNLPYESQLYYKQKQVVEQFRRIGGIPSEVLDQISPILGSDNTRLYRNKLEFTFSDSRWLSENEMHTDSPIVDNNALGFHVPGRYDKVLDLKDCYLQPEPSNQIRKWFRTYTDAHNHSYFNLRYHRGMMRNLIIRNTLSGEIMVIVVFFEDQEKERIKMLDAFRKAFPTIQSIMYVINQKANDTILDQELFLYHGRDHIIEQMENLKFRIGPKSFYQTNSNQALRLYKVVRNFAGLGGNESVWDWYAGTGTIAIFLATSCKLVLGIESVPEAIEDATINAAMNGITNAHFLGTDMKDIDTTNLISTYGKPDVIVMDPPRAGIHRKVTEHLIQVKPERVIYVSCNPATQARDLALLVDHYNVEKIQPVDMFPQTHHVENVVMLVRK